MQVVKVHTHHPRHGVHDGKDFVQHDGLASCPCRRQLRAQGGLYCGQYGLGPMRRIDMDLASEAKQDRVIRLQTQAVGIAGSPQRG